MGRRPKTPAPVGCLACGMRGWLIGRNGFPVECACRDKSPLTRALEKAQPRRFTGQPITGFGALL